MKMNHLLLIVAIHVFASAIAFAKECPDDTLVNNLPAGKTFLTVVNDEGLTPRNSSYFCVAGSCDRKYLLEMKDFFSWGRYFKMGIMDDFVDSLKNETYVFQGALKEEWSDVKDPLDVKLSFVNVKHLHVLKEENLGKRSEIRFYQYRSSLDLRKRAMTYGSMKYNIGSQFKLTANCN